MENVLIVTNFSAGRRLAVKYKKLVLDFVLKQAKNFKFVDIDEFKVVDVSDFDTILVMGGDGTVNKVLPCLVNTNKVLGIIPCGTANLLAAKLNIPTNVDKSLNIINANNIKKIDVLKVNERFCILRCGFGYDSDIICKTPQSLKNKFGYLAYFIAGIIFALRLKYKKYFLTIDNEEHTIDATNIIVGNASNMYKNLVSVGKNSKLDDGLMDIFILKTSNPIIFFIEFLMIIFNIKFNDKYVEYIQAKTVQLKTEWQNCHIDGEKNNFSEDMNISIYKNCLNVFANK